MSYNIYFLIILIYVFHKNLYRASCRYKWYTLLAKGSETFFIYITVSVLLIKTGTSLNITYITLPWHRGKPSSY